ncbi:MAG TPA: hypothetical protein VFW00_08030, partial [Rhodocyclaceae bacterium]|nr:hypothetical protein [Rhodocyclaceae bacterium]
EGRPIGQWGDIAIASLTKFLPVQEGGVIASHSRSLQSVRPVGRGAMTEVKALMDLIEVGSRYQRFGGFNALFNGVFSLKNKLRNGAARTAVPADDAQQPNGDHALDPTLINARIAHVSRWTVETALRERVIAQRRANFARLVGLLSDMRGGHPLLTELPPDAAPYVFPFVSDNADPRYRALRRLGLPLFRWDWLWPDTPHIAGDTGLVWSHSIFQLPCHQDLDEAALLCIANTVREVCRAHPA